MSSSALAAGIRQLRRKLAGQQPSEESDEQLLHGFLSRRDDSAFAAVMRRHGPMVMQVCRRVLGHEQDAEDAFQATFLVLARKAASLRSKTSLASFLHGIAYRTAMKAKQSAVRRRKYEGSLGALTQPRSSSDPADELSWREVRELLDEEIACLPEKYRSVFILCCLEELSRAEAASRLELKERTVLSRLAEARKRLAQRLARRGVELTAALAVSTLATSPTPALSPLLMAATIKAALSEGTAPLVSAQTAALVKSVESAAIFSKTKIVTAVLWIVSMAAGAVAWTVSVNGVRLGTDVLSATPAPQPAQAQSAEAPPQKKGNVVVKGRVLGPDGKPIQGARLYSARGEEHWSHKAVVVLAPTGPTDENGRFHLRLNKPNRGGDAYLIAHAAGFGVDWINLEEDDLSSEVALRLAKDVPITGRVVNTEGRPVPGVSVSVSSVWVPANGKLDDYLSGWLGGQMKFLDSLSSPRKRLNAPLDTVSGTVMTDKDGRYTLRGAGAERIVHVTFSGGGIAQTTPYIITRPGFDAKPYNAALRKEEGDRKFVEGNRFYGPYPPELTFVAEAGKTIEGVVKDAASGQPLAGCRVSTGTSHAHGIEIVANAEGKYRLEGLAKRSGGYSVWVRPPQSSAYLYRNVKAADTLAFTKIRLDIELVKGAIVTGRVVDRQTGKGVRCGVSAVPLPGNRSFGSKPGYDRTNAYEALEQGEDGSFRLVSIPGKVLLSARVWHKGLNGEPLCVYRSALPDPEHKELFLEADGTWRVLTASGVSKFLSIENAVKVIEVKENGENRVELSVDPGATARIVVQDTDGNPLVGTWASGLTECWPICYQLPEATATVYALNPDKPRTMAFYHAERKLGGRAVVRGGEKEQVVVKLAPVGRISGRLLDEGGHPLQGIEVSIHAQEEIGSELYRFAARRGKPVHTDKDGRFHVDGVVPDLKFRLNLRKERTFFVREPRLGVRQIQPRETLALGDIRVKPLRR